MNYEKQVEELEEGCPYDIGEDLGHCSECLKKAKDLKAEIEKGCGKEIESKFDKYNIYYECGDNFARTTTIFQEKVLLSEKKRLCKTCQNLINRLNKIIGENDD